MVVRLWVVVTVDVSWRNERIFKLPWLFRGGICLLAVLKNSPEDTVGRDGDGKKQEWVRILVLRGSHMFQVRARLNRKQTSTPSWPDAHGSTASATTTNAKMPPPDIRHSHGSDIQVVCANKDDAPDLIAIGGMHSVQVLQFVRVPVIRVETRTDLVQADSDIVHRHSRLSYRLQSDCDRMVTGV